jgi:hypothetical protein
MIKRLYIQSKITGIQKSLTKAINSGSLPEEKKAEAIRLLKILMSNKKDIAAILEALHNIQSKGNFPTMKELNDLLEIDKLKEFVSKFTDNS